MSEKKPYYKALADANQRVAALVQSALDAISEDDIDQSCQFHNGMVHGREAEQLRSGLENLIEAHDGEFHWDCSGGNNEPVVTVKRLQELLDKVDACDSLAFLERNK